MSDTQKATFAAVASALLIPALGLSGCVEKKVSMPRRVQAIMPANTKAMDSYRSDAIDIYVAAAEKDKVCVVVNTSKELKGICIAEANATLVKVEKTLSSSRLDQYKAQFGQITVKVNQTSKDTSMSSFTANGQPVQGQVINAQQPLRKLPSSPQPAPKSP